jgi:glycerol-3-phosphate acyltransferase PlsX
MPSSAAHCLLLDVGANDECNPEWLVQFANMGTVYMQNVRGIASPRVGLLNIGKEQGKGTAFVNAVYELLAQDAGIQFIGNVEGRDIFNGSVDVAVCDGFTGNIALKSAEGMVKMMQSCMKTEFTKSWRTKLGALLAKPAFAGIKHQVDPDEYGGALFLGVDGVCVKAHGGSKASAIQNAIRVAKDAVDAKVLEKIRHQIKHNTMIQGSEAVSS